MAKLFATATLKSIAFAKLLPFLGHIPSPFSLGSTSFDFNKTGSDLGPLSVFPKNGVRYGSHTDVINLSINVDSVSLIHVRFTLQSLTKDTSSSTFARYSIYDLGHTVTIISVEVNSELGCALNYFKDPSTSWG